MNRLSQSKHSSEMRAKRVRAKIHGTKECPRLSVNISIKHITAQLINDDTSSTIAYASTVGQKLTGTMTEKAGAIGKTLATNAKKANINKVVFDRGSKLYHGRVEALADAARKEGMEF